MLLNKVVIVAHLRTTVHTQYKHHLSVAFSRVACFSICSLHFLLLIAVPSNMSSQLFTLRLYAVVVQS